MRWIKDIIINLINRISERANPEKVRESIQAQLDSFKTEMLDWKNPNGRSFYSSDYYNNILPYLIEALEELQIEQSTYTKEVLTEKFDSKK